MENTILRAMGLTYDQAEWQYRQGFIDQVDWDLFRFYWRNGAPRFTDLAAAFEIKVTL